MRPPKIVEVVTPGQGGSRYLLGPDGRHGITAFQLYTRNGQMAPVEWIAATHEDGSETHFNIAHVESYRTVPGGEGSDG